MVHSNIDWWNFNYNISFELETLADGTIMNNIAVQTTNNILKVVQNIILDLKYQIKIKKRYI